MALVTLNRIRTPAHAGQALECEYWQLERGQKWVVLGGNGAGKTVFANLLLGKQALARGERLLAESLDPKSDFTLVSFEQQHALHAHDDRFDDSELREDANDPGTLVYQFLDRPNPPSASYRQWLKLLGLETLENSGIRQLSTGQMRKLMIAHAVLAKSQVLILDDPMAGLDADMQAGFSGILQQVFAQLDTVMLLSSRLNDVPPQASHLLLLAGGKVIQQGEITPSLLDLARQVLAQEAPQVQPLKSQSPATVLQPVSSSDVDDECLIEMHDVDVSYADKKIFRALNWTLRVGQHALIVGPNGCGKSTLLNMLTGENAKAYGQKVRLFGRLKGSGESIWELRQHFGLVSTQLQRQYARANSVLDVVVSGFYDSVGLHTVPAELEKERALASLASVGAEQLLSQRYQHLSYGQQRLVLIARAMVKQPRILILDEPCIGLDDNNRRTVLAVIDGIAASGQTHILFVSHLSDEWPQCINQRLQFHWREGWNCYSIAVSNSPG